MDTDPEITSKREQSEDDEVPVETMPDLEIVEDGKVTDEVLSEHWSDSAKKRGRRKTLEELFLDSPSELAVENAFQVQVTNTVQLHRRIFFISICNRKLSGSRRCTLTVHSKS